MQVVLEDEDALLRQANMGDRNVTVGTQQQRLNDSDAFGYETVFDKMRVIVHNIPHRRGLSCHRRYSSLHLFFSYSKT